MPKVNLDAAELVAYTRYEPVMRINDFQPTIKADVHDALWMLTQQWRVGEFNGEDAGSIVKAKIETQSTHVNRFKSRNGSVEAFDETVPLEAKVERLPVFIDLAMQLEIGMQWLKILRRNGFGNTYDQVFKTAFPVTASFPSEPEKESNSNAMQVRQIAAGRMMDGGAFLQYLKTHTAHSVAGVAAGDATSIDAAATQLTTWFKRTYYQPQSATENSWSDTQLEYQFSMSAPLANTTSAAQNVFLADKYRDGTVEWYSFDVNPDSNARLNESPANSISNNVVEQPVVISYLTHPVEFKGMPKGRWWEFEDKNIDIAKMLTQKQDIAKLVLMEFGLIYSNDWFVIPHNLPNGSVSAVNGLVVTDVFNQQYLIKRAGSGLDDQWQRWDMFNINKRGITNDSTFDKLLTVPAVLNRMESEPLEKVVFLRDEMANMVWGVEEIIPSELQSGMNGLDAYNYLLQYLEQTYTPPTQAGYVGNSAVHRYKLSTSVPENWIPFVASRTSSTARNVMLQRASMLRYINDDYTPQPVKPRTKILGVGLDQTPQQAYFINEEEASNSGFVVTTNYQRTRWYDGSTYLWLGRKKQTGKGEGNSGLAFDLLQDKEPD